MAFWHGFADARIDGLMGFPEVIEAVLPRTRVHLKKMEDAHPRLESRFESLCD